MNYFQQVIAHVCGLYEYINGLQNREYKYASELSESKRQCNRLKYELNKHRDNNRDLYGYSQKSEKLNDALTVELELLKEENKKCRDQK